jgi:protein-tyrosine-phosphatase
MSTVFAERERQRRDLEDRVEILTGGTHPADHVHDEVIAVMDEAGLDLTGRSPREISLPELRSCDIVATMGCSTLDVGEVGEDVDIRDWALEDPDGADLDQVRGIRDEIEQRVLNLFNEFSEDR